MSLPGELTGDSLSESFVVFAAFSSFAGSEE
jgi:hypothetical protein